MANKKSINKKEDSGARQAVMVVAVIICLVVIYYISNFIFQSSNTVNYQGLLFIKNQTAGVTFYEHYYYLEIGNKTIPSVLYVRINPKDNKVPVNGTIEFPAGKFVYISTNLSSIDRCEDNFVSSAAFRLFLSYNGLTIRESSPDREEAAAYNLSFSDCENRPGNPVILIYGSNQTSITRTGTYCYNIAVNGCDLTRALEKFEVQSIIDSKSN